MAALAVVLQDGENVLVESGNCLLRRKGRGGCNRSDDRDKKHDQDEPAPHSNSVLGLGFPIKWSP